ncbi:MAG: riboflavin transporter [Clostridia bacterium]|jgi:riboflavin transporter FmnP|nr:riboflavin transporter [Clostridia bacterium]MDN5322243.1 riboflavin transporter [Clostridia bacterium]
MNTKIMARIALLSAFGLILQFFAFPLPFFPEYLRYDAAEVPALIAAFAIGPWAGVLVDLGKNLLSFLIGNAPAGLIGITANFIAGASFAFVAGLIYSTHKTRKQAVVAIAIGVISTTVVMAIANYFWLLPLWGVPRNGILPLLTASIIPFNLFKGSLTGLFTFILYKKVKVFLEPEFTKKKEAYVEK